MTRRAHWAEIHKASDRPMNSWVGLSISAVCARRKGEREKENVVDGAGGDAGGTRGSGAVGAADSEGAPE